MKKLKFKKEKFDYKRFLGTRKYKLSFSGAGPQIDWIIALFLFLIGFVFLILYFFARMDSINNYLDQEIIVEDKEYFDLKNAEDLLNKYYLNTDDISETNINQEEELNFLEDELLDFDAEINQELENIQ